MVKKWSKALWENELLSNNSWYKTNLSLVFFACTTTEHNSCFLLSVESYSSLLLTQNVQCLHSVNLSPSVQHRTHQLESFHAPCISYWKTSIVYRWVLKFHQSSWRRRNCFCKISVAILLKQEKPTSHLLTNLIPECLWCQVGVDASFPCDWVWVDINIDLYLTWGVFTQFIQF